MPELPDLRRYDRIAFDTETTGLTWNDRPVGLSLAAPDGQSWYFSWGAGDPKGIRGPAAMNNVALADVQAWARGQLRGGTQLRVAHNAPFDMRMLAYVGIAVDNVADTMIAATLLDENRTSFTLNDVAQGLGLGVKADDALHAWMVANIPECRRLKPTRRALAPHYWRVPVSEMREYAAHDAVLTIGAYDALRPLVRKGDADGSFDYVYDLETALLPVLLKMHLTGVRADIARAEAVVDDLTRQLEVLVGKWRADYGDANYRSADDLKPILDAAGIVYPLTEKTKKPSITKEWLENLDHPIGDRVRQMRQLEHYRDTFVRGYVLDNCGDGDVIHGEFNAFGAKRSGRFSSSGPLNLQNVPARDKVWAPLIRGLFRPMRDDQRWLKVDYSQIEYRYFAHYAGVLARHRGTTSAMEQAYVADPRIDFHQWVAETAGIERRKAKNVNFCRLYGGGIGKIAETAGCTVAEAAEFVAAYDRHIPEAEQLMRAVTSQAERKGKVITWGGRRNRLITEGVAALRYGVQPRHPDRYYKSYTALNRLLQGSAADLIKIAMVDIDRAGYVDSEDVQLHLTVHDELDFSVPHGEAGDRAMREIVEIMQDAGKRPAWDGTVMRVPVIAEAKFGPNWGATE